jgi:hypothetical protein
MTVTAFDRLLYTDCRAGTGRGAGGGFQVQAQSAGVDAAQAKMAVGWLLYEAPSAWIVQRRPVGEFPLGLAHATTAGYGTAQSRYLGTEATGARQGNHLADCLLTRDVALYGPVRPAQLWRSPLWRSQAWDSTQCPQLDETPPPGPLTVDAVADWLRSSPARAPVLARIVSVLEDPAGHRVVISAGGPDQAMPWIAAATLLLPIRAAVEVSFKVFCSNPLQSSHRVVAVSRELNPQVVPGRADSVFVVDADAAASDEAEVSGRARFWVERFAGAEDPYDVIEAVELAGQLGGKTAQAQADGLVTSWAVTVPDSPLADASALSRWLSGADPAVRQEHGSAVVSRILAAEPPATTLRLIDTLAASTGIGIDRPAVRARLLTAEIAEIRAGGTPPAEPLTEVVADDHARRDADSELSSAIVMGPDPQVDLLLRLARRHRAEPQLSPLRDRLRDFALGWIDKPGRPYRPAGWALRQEILDMVHGELHERLARDGLPAVMAAIRQLGRHLAGRPGDPDDPLYCHLQAAEISALPRQQRLAALPALIQQARYAAAPAAAIARLQRALIDWQALGPAGAVLILQALPEGVPPAPEITVIALGEIDRTAARPTASTLDALAILHRCGVAPPEEPFSYLLGQDQAVRDFIRAAGAPRFGQDRSSYQQWLTYLGEVDPAVINARIGSLLDACLDLATPGLGARVISVIPAPLPRLFIDRWRRELSGPRAVRAAVEGVFWHESSSLPGHLKSRIAEALGGYASMLSPGQFDLWFGQVGEKLPADWDKAWARLAGQDAVPRHRVLRGRGKDA